MVGTAKKDVSAVKVRKVLILKIPWNIKGVRK